eukprot:gnl/TRDRNA2_/TRDRNA2_122035_c0_seq1.p1 gnl/TRDRNA2_/TRDRNA2_122035_c0~~gnl/TRDRNA2_/TRDRNA2_122035_c0_seq1.p1  ORF type:complete len:241 (-),score=64.70 gnl/TRDRNA2_/TRDRNA2_122035_c0_seq1:31-753(-)
MPLSDGSNAEKEDPNPIPNWKSKDDLKDVILYQKYKPSPPSCKIRTWLKFFDIPFKTQKKPAPGPYKLTPSLTVSGNKVNDSFIIVKHLSLGLFGSFDEEFEKKMTYEVMVSVEAKVLTDKQAVKGFFLTSGEMPGCVGCMVGSLGGHLAKGIVKKFPDLKEPLEYFKEFRSLLGDKKFYAGDKPGQHDVSFYGTMVSFVENECQIIIKWLEEADLMDWWKRMDAQLGAPEWKAVPKPWK